MRVAGVEQRTHTHTTLQSHGSRLRGACLAAICARVNPLCMRGPLTRWHGQETEGGGRGQVQEIRSQGRGADKPDASHGQWSSSNSLCASGVAHTCTTWPRTTERESDERKNRRRSGHGAPRHRHAPHAPTRESQSGQRRRRVCGRHAQQRCLPCGKLRLCDATSLNTALKHTHTHTSRTHVHDPFKPLPTPALTYMYARASWAAHTRLDSTALAGQHLGIRLDAVLGVLVRHFLQHGALLAALDEVDVDAEAAVAARRCGTLRRPRSRWHRLNMHRRR